MCVRYDKKMGSNKSGDEPRTDIHTDAWTELRTELHMESGKELARRKKLRFFSWMVYKQLKNNPVAIISALTSGRLDLLSDEVTDFYWERDILAEELV